MSKIQNQLEESSIKFVRTYIDTHGIPDSIRNDQFSGFKGKAMKKFCSANNSTLWGTTENVGESSGLYKNKKK